ncbi:RNA methyltransferase [Mycoplasmopsis maculosa]|uniref:RNA methyltransferase n=1 Tax=Mycoplasmopsis maculosa TaxID=114885 RepID=A0A449B4G8_9BACT|nr:RNA methyltransferase [Mycoplasmopsis maculosa]VEU75501.1 RNA methyltransferase [Mycoplasmopsis maculosa]
MRKVITSNQNTKIKELKKHINNNKSDFFIVEGYNLVEEAINKKYCLEIYELFGKEKYSDSILVSDNVLNSVCTTKNPEGIFALCKKENIKNNNFEKIVFLDNLQDPGNIGTIIRSSVAFEFNAVFSNSNFYNDKIIRSSQGALFNINLVNYNNSFLELKKLKEDGYKLYGTTLSSNSIPLNDVNFDSKKIVIIFGNEGNGIKKEIYDLLDFKVYIPIKFESLNVSVSAGIVLNKISNG